MEDQEIIKLWKTYDKKLDASLQFNRRNAEDITRMKVKSFLESMKPLKAFTILAGILWVGFLDVLIINFWSVANPFFLISAGIVMVLNNLSLVMYLYQLILIHRADVSDPIIATQAKLASLRASTLWIARLLFLQLPMWTTFYWNESMLANGNVWLYSIQFVVTGSLTYLAIWLYLNITYENRNKKWFGFIFNGKEWTPVIKSMELLREMAEYNQESTKGNENITG